MKKESLFSNDCYVINKDYRIEYFNESISRKYQGIQVGDYCYKAIMNRNEPCNHCPVAGNSDSDSPVYYDSFYGSWVEAGFCRLDDNRCAVIRRPSEPINDEIFELLCGDEREILRSKSNGEDANQVIHMIADKANSIIKANSKLFFLLCAFDLVNDGYEVIYEESWVRDIVGVPDKASEAIKIIADDLAMPYMRVDMSAFTNLSTISKRLKERRVLSQKYESITGESARALIMPIETDSKGNAVRVVLGLAYSNHEEQKPEKDPLTGIYTRNAFISYAREWLGAHPFSVINVLTADIKNFKNVNSVYGEKKADELLKYLAEYISGHFPEGICARYGADQIVCMYTSATKRDTDWFEDFLFAFASDSPIPYVTLKVGIYRNADKNLSVIDMCDRALMALKSIKQKYEANIAFYDGPFSKHRLKVQEYESSFINAIKKKEFKVWFQPKYEPYNGEIVGAEALVRWEKKDGAFIPPGDFISVFEEDGLISVLDEYVFTEVCEMLGKRKKAGKRIVPVSVNLSRKSIRRQDLVKNYQQISADYGIELDKVPIEITESAAVGNTEFMPMAEALNEAGFTIHMDDFGSEHSSLNGLSMLHLSAVKFDKSLIDNIGTKEGDLVLEYTMALAKNLGFKIVAEGVEDENQVKFLKKHACDCIQGYYYSKPVPLKEFEKILQ